MANIIKMSSRYIETNCYIIENNNGFLIIDPCIQLKNIQNETSKKCLGILLTHGHADHIVDLQEVYEFYQCPIYCHKNCYNKLFNNSYNMASLLRMKLSINIAIDKFIFVNNDFHIPFDNDIIRVLYTPGHSNCSVCYEYNNVLFTGDTLFNGDIGRTDLFSGNSYELRNSLQNIFKQKIDYTIYPGHEEEGKLSNQLKINKSLIQLLH